MTAFLENHFEKSTYYIDHHSCPIKPEKPWGEFRCPDSWDPTGLTLTITLDRKVYEIGGDLLDIVPCDWF